jgi:hypothetical protein
MENHTRPLIQEFNMAFKAGNRLATVLGGLLATIVPIMVFAVSHKLPTLSYTDWKFYVLLIMTVGGCYFSLKSVVLWGKRAYMGDKAKAVSYALLLEGMLIMSGMFEDMHWLGIVALIWLCAINTISAGCAIALEDKAYSSAKYQESRSNPKKKAITKKPVIA